MYKSNIYIYIYIYIFIGDTFYCKNDIVKKKKKNSLNMICLNESHLSVKVK